jgi:hypothetical protein
MIYLKNTYLVKFNTSSTGETYGMIVEAKTWQEAASTATKLAKFTHYGVSGVMSIDADGRGNEKD